MVEPIDESVLVARAQQRRLDAFEDLARRHYGAVYRIALRMLGNRADAEDATQEAFERAWKGIAGFHGRSTFLTWMYRIVTNTCLKAERRRRRTILVDDLAQTADSPHDRPDRRAESAARQAALTRAIMALTPEQRATLVLRAFGECSYEEIAQVLGLTVPAVRGRLHRARLELMEAMQQWR